MVLLWELNSQSTKNVTYKSDKCRQCVESRYHCTECQDFDLCIQCYENKGGHEYKMIKLMVGEKYMESSKYLCQQNKVFINLFILIFKN